MIKFIRLIYIAIRPKTLVISMLPIVIGSALSWKYGLFNHTIFLFTLLSAIFIQIGTNFANDVYDYIKGADDEERLGPIRVVQAQLISIKNMKIFTAIAFLLSILFGFPLVLKGGIPILIIGLLSIISGYAYTAGPYPLGYNGWGDFFVFCFFGPIAVSGTYFLQNETISYASFYSGIIMGSLSVLLLCINNLRDIKTDQRAGKRTLAVRFGANFVRMMFILFIFTSYFSSYYLTFYIDIINKNSFYLLLLITIPLSLLITSNIFTLKGESLNLVFGKVIFFIILYSSLLVASILV